MALSWRNLARSITEIAVRDGPRVLQQIARTAQPRARQGPPRRTGTRAGTAAADRSPGSGAPTPLRPSREVAARGPHLAYAPQPDGRADPGEVVWTWVTYEEDAGQGKDRPVLVVGRDGGRLLGLMLSSQHARDGQHGWLGLGAGAWDREARASWVRLDRVLEVLADGIRREGAVLDRRRFDLVAAALRDGYGWR